MNKCLKTKKNRRSSKKNKTKKYKNKVIFVGANAAGISSKLASFDDMLETLQPTVFFIEETKLKTGGNLKTKNTKQFQIFELNRKSKSGGGLAVGAINDVEPVLVSEGDDETEIIVIEIKVAGLKIRCICGYGPQENSIMTKKLKFWEKLSDEVEDALANDLGIVFQMDGNLWAGPEVVSNDPNQCNMNGKLFKQFLNKFPQLTVVNSLDLCQGLITRRRVTTNRTEESILDFFVVCDKVLCFTDRMIIDEDKKFVLSNYRKVNGVVHKKDSDHFTTILELNIEYTVKKPDRIELFNFRNEKCQEIFCQITNNSPELINCFQKDGNLDSQAKKWFKTLKGIFYKSFNKIRHTGKRLKTKFSSLMEERRTLLAKLGKLAEDEEDEARSKLTKVEEKICEMVAEENRDKVVNNFKVLAKPGGLCNTNGMWSLKRKVFPKNKESLPFAKKDCDGKIITAQSELKKLYLETFVHRLRHRPVSVKYQYLKKLKEELCFKRIRYAKRHKTQPWTLSEMRKTLRKLKDNKSRDPHGLLNELFKPGVIGKDLEISLLKLLNKVKMENNIPAIMQFVNIVAIYKGKGKKIDLTNDRGIFLVNIFRAVLMKMIYKDNYDTVDGNMSDSNVGARRKKNIRNHIFILNGIINETLQNKKPAIDIIIVDYKQCFDGLWLEESMNDLFEAGIQDSSLATIYEANSKNQVAVKTPFGITERKTVEKIVLQGEVFGPLECSVSVDKFGKECLEQNKHLYNYRNEVGVPPLAMIDDVACVAECGINSVAVNAYINAKSNTKKLQFGVDKCHQLHIGKENKLCPDLFIDNWEVVKVESSKTGFSNLTDKKTEPHKMEMVQKEKYLGDLISVTGKNTENIMSRKEKSKGITKQILSILEDICFGPFKFEVALILRNSLFLSSVLVNSEAWYNLTENDLELLEQADEELLRKILDAPVSTPKCMLYLETGSKPVRYLLMTRRLMFYHYILNEDEDSLIKRFYKTQTKDPCKGDWCTTVGENLDELEIMIDEDQIKLCSENQFKTLVDKCIMKRSLSYLKSEQESKSKVSHLNFTDLKIQKYLEANPHTYKLGKFICLARSRMLDLGENFKKGKNNIKTLCPVCEDREALDSQQHLLVCPQLVQNLLLGNAVKYEDLFGIDLEKQVQVANILQLNLEKRKRILKEKKK